MLKVKRPYARLKVCRITPSIKLYMVLLYLSAKCVISTIPKCLERSIPDLTFLFFFFRRLFKEIEKYSPVAISKLSVIPFHEGLDGFSTTTKRP